MNPYRNEVVVEFAGESHTFVVTFDRLAKIEGVFGAGLFVVLNKLGRGDATLPQLREVMKLFTSLKQVEIENAILSIGLPEAIRLVTGIVMVGFDAGNTLPKEQAVKS